jgi:ubiquinone/menaquinone biosynthesis C-methylase UbiE
LVLGKLQTRHCYRFVLEQAERGSRILDVGIGTGTYLLDLANLIRAKDLQVTGVDVRSDYLAWCDAAVRRCGLSDHVTTLQQDVFQLRPRREDKYHCVVLVTTWTVLPDREKLLPLAREQLLSPGGRLIIANAFYRRGPTTLLLNFFRVWVIGWMVGYGKCTHMDELTATLEASGYDVSAKRIPYGLAARCVESYAVVASVRGQGSRRVD